MTNYQKKCFLSLAIKALELKRKFKLYTAEKEYAKAENKNAEINKCLCTELSESFNTVLNAPKNVKSTSFFNKLFAEDSVENFILKSIFGFLGGVFVTYVCFMFLVFPLNFSLKRAAYICIGLGVILSLGLAFSVRIRCTVFLCIPQLFSKRGRQALLAYAFILALSGPAKNTLHNVGVMSESLACTQEQLKQIENELVKCVQTPNAAAKKSVEKLLEKITFAVKDFKNFILGLYKNCFDILETLLNAQKWLYSITLLCHKKMGRPAHRCLNLLAEAKETCEASTISKEFWRILCHIRPDVEELICSAKERSVCMKSDVAESLPVLKLQKQVKYFKRRAMNIFFVGIEAHQTYSQTNRTHTYHEEYQGMATEIRQKTDQFLQYFDFMSVIFGIFILVVFVKVIIYRHKFLTEDHYDNRYITADFVDIDNTRAAFFMDTVLPLAPKERMQYIKVSSVRLVPCERVRLLSSFIFLIFATFKIVIHMLTDSSLYWILSTVRRNEKSLYMSTLKEDEPSSTVQIVGDGLVAALLRNVSAAVKRESTLSKLDPTPCLPDPVPPDWNRYYQISLVIICWLLALWEPYGLRLRHTVMVTYHPDRARERAIWLYNKIISNRNSFVKISRRKLRRKYKNVTLEDTFRYKFLRKTFSSKCLLCKTVVKKTDSYVKCSTPKCIGFYCTPCFECLKICSICKDPTEYGDFSDLSEEKDSSEEEILCKSPGKKAAAKKYNRSKDKKEGLSLHIKKTNIKLKKGRKEEKSELKSSKKFIQPDLIFGAVQYCRSKIPAFGPLKSLSDVESSDWDHDSSLISEESPVERKVSDVEKTDEEKNSDFEEKLINKTNSEQIKGTVRRNNDLNESGTQIQKVCLFKKMSSTGLDSVVKCNYTFENYKDISDRKNGSAYDAPFEGQTCEYYDCTTSDFDPLSFLKLVNSKKVLKKKPIKTDRSTSDFTRKRDSGALINERVEEAIKNELKFDIRFHTEDLDTDFSQLENSDGKRPHVFPFIDPTNIHQLVLSEGSEEESEFRLETTNIESARRLTKRRGKRSGLYTAQAATPRMPHSLSRTKMCSEGNDSSDSANENVRICLKEGMQSSTESGCQFYKESYCSSKVLLESEETNSDIKRASAKLNLNINTTKFINLYSVETDSSNDKFMTVKLSPKVRKKHKTTRQTQKESDIILKLSISSPRVMETKRNEFLQSEIVQFIEGEYLEGSESFDTYHVTGRERGSAIEEFRELSRDCVKTGIGNTRTDSEYFSLATDSLPGFHLPPLTEVSDFSSHSSTDPN